MATRLNPYLTFNGNAREAMEFYEGVFGGTLTVNTFGDYGGPAESADQVMHAMLETPSGFTLMAADPPPGENPASAGDNFAISLSGDEDAELRGYWDKLSGSGTVAVPLDKQIWGDVFGMCTDRFGITWVVNIAGSDA